MVSMIAAIGINRELGQGNELIWKIPNDLKRFKELTEGHPIIMGRKTYESIGRVLPNRTNIIVSRDPEYKIEEGIVVNSIEQGLDVAKNEPGSEEVFIIGGAQVYSLGIKFADRLYLTKINAQAPKADAFFPDYSADFTKKTFSEKHNENGLEYEFVNLERNSL